MGFTHEHRAARIDATKSKYNTVEPNVRLQTLATLLQSSRNFEKQFDLGLLEWETLSSLRGQTNATITGLLDVMHEKNEIDLRTCQVWKTHHPHVWMFIDEPRFVAEAVHKQFLTILGDITKKNPMLKSLAVQLSKHNWDSMVMDKNMRAAQENSYIAINSLSTQLRENKLEREVGILWDYYAPPAPGKAPSFAWLTEYVPPVVVNSVEASAPVAPINVADLVNDAISNMSMDDMDMGAPIDISDLPTSDSMADPFMDGPLYDQDDLDMLAGM